MVQPYNPTYEELLNPNAYAEFFETVLKSKLGDKLSDFLGKKPYFLQKLAEDLVRKAEPRVMALLRDRYAQPSYVTKLDESVVEEIWMIFSKIFSEMEDEISLEQNHSIREVNQAIEPFERYKGLYPYELVRLGIETENQAVDLWERLNRVNYRLGILSMMKNSLFDFWKEKYGIFKEPKPELRTDKR